VSYYPCERCKARVPGALCSLRFTLLLDQDSYSRRMRLCDAHYLEAVQESTRQWEILGSDQADPANGMCVSCGEAVSDFGSPVAGFGWLYPRGLDPVNLATQFCHPCGIAFINLRGLTKQSPRTST